MATVTPQSPLPLPEADWLASIEQLTAQQLAPQVQQIDAQGVYPAAFMRALGQLGVYRQTVSTSRGGDGRGMRLTIQAMEIVARECLSTGFCVWCDAVCVWYVQNSRNCALIDQWLPPLMSGERLGATGMSNPMKHFAGIERMHLTAEPSAGGGYTVSGALPWVSNVAPDHCFAAVAKIADTESDYVMFLTPGDLPGVALGDGGHFIALEGSSTHNAIFKQAKISESLVLAAPCAAYIGAIRAGFILMQTGFGLGLVESCITLMRRADERLGHVNQYLPDSADDLARDLDATRHSVYQLADTIGCGERPLGLEATQTAVQLRIEASELSLRASQAAMLHAGATGYRSGSVAERKLRESYFVAVVTPALKHLKKLQADWKAAA